MKTENIIKSKVADAADKLHNGVDATEEHLDESVDAFSALLASAKEMSGLASTQMRTHPLAAFGVAFVAGIAVARLLRR
jgi:ElaB/YqjD/DUF883 family membrane-anchored ribosome-binding protein